MAMEQLPEHLKSRRTGEAIMAPSAIVAGGAGASVAILLGAPLFGVVALGALAYGALVALRLPRKPRPFRDIDPKSLSQPWGRYVHESLQARRRYADLLTSVKPGPIRDALHEIGSRLDAAVQECWRVASHGDALDDGLETLDLENVRQRLDAIRRDEPANDSPSHKSWEQTCQALEAQLASGQRLEAVATDARQRLEVLDARLDETVARAVELSLSAGDVSALTGLGADLDQLVGDMEALRQGLEEAGRVARS
jgi:hypothetical protein